MDRVLKLEEINVNYTINLIYFLKIKFRNPMYSFKTYYKNSF